MLEIVLNCPCGNSKFASHRIDDGRSEYTYLSGCGICEFCRKNDGDFTKSPHWKEPSPKTILAAQTKKEVGKVPKL